jgi:head-tail adaptor
MLQRMISNHGKEFTVQRSISSPNGIGGNRVTWSDFATAKGVLSPSLVKEATGISGAERKTAMQKQQFVSYKLYTDFFDVTDLDRIKIGEKLYNIKKVVNPMEMNRYCEIHMEFKSYVQE